MKFATCFPEEEVIKLLRLKHFEEGLVEQTKARREGIEGVATAYDQFILSRGERIKRMAGSLNNLPVPIPTSIGASCHLHVPLQTFTNY